MTQTLGRMKMSLLKYAILGSTCLIASAYGRGRFDTLYSFGAAPDGQVPAGLTAANGILYGTTSEGGTGCGTVFALAPPNEAGGAWTESTLYTFSGLNGVGCEPWAGPVFGANGSLYGTTLAGGDSLSGTVFELRPPSSSGEPWTAAVLYSFKGGNDGGAPFAGVILGPAGALYGTTIDGMYDSGNVFELRPPSPGGVAGGGPWEETVLYSFTAGYGTDGSIPVGLTRGAQGVLYGVTEMGGTSEASAGTVFALLPPTAPGSAWTEKVLYSFQGGADGSSPWWPVVAGSDGSLYGATFGTAMIGPYTGPYGVGTVFQLTPSASPGGSWDKIMLQQFGNGRLRGPDSPLILRNGNLFGTSSSPAGGVVFELQHPSEPGGPWGVVILHEFTDGQEPGGNLVMDEHGVIYGTTIGPYTNPAGTVYRIIP